MVPAPAFDTTADRVYCATFSMVPFRRPLMCTSAKPCCLVEPTPTVQLSVKPSADVSLACWSAVSWMTMWLVRFSFFENLSVSVVLFSLNAVNLPKSTEVPSLSLAVTVTPFSESVPNRFTQVLIEVGVNVSPLLGLMVHSTAFVVPTGPKPAMTILFPSLSFVVCDVLREYFKSPVFTETRLKPFSGDLVYCVAQLSSLNGHETLASSFWQVCAFAATITNRAMSKSPNLSRFLFICLPFRLLYLL